MTVKLAAELSLQNVRCVTIDANPSATPHNWNQDRSERSPEVPHVAVRPLRGQIRNNHLDLEEVYGMVLVDVGGHDSQESRQAGVTSDLLIPTTTSQPDLDSPLLEEFKTFNPDTTVRGLFNRIETNPKATAD